MSKGRNIRKFAVLIYFLLALCFASNLLAQGETHSPAAYFIRLKMDAKDSIKKVTAQVLMKDSSGEKKPVSGTEVHIYVERTFNPLPIGEVQTTDDNGEVTVEFPADIPGDSVGNIIVIARTEEDEKVGNIETEETVKWGVPVVDKVLTERALWASGANAPIPLVVIVTGLIAGVWGVIVYIIIQLFKIRKAGA